jgi:hypothetical protein
MDVSLRGDVALDDETSGDSRPDRSIALEEMKTRSHPLVLLVFCAP